MGLVRWVSLPGSVAPVGPVGRCGRWGVWADQAERVLQTREQKMERGGASASCTSRSVIVSDCECAVRSRASSRDGGGVWAGRRGGQRRW